MELFQERFGGVVGMETLWRNFATMVSNETAIGWECEENELSMGETNRGLFAGEDWTGSKALVRGGGGIAGA